MGTVTKSIEALLGIVFLGSGGQKLAGTDPIVDEFARFRYPRWFRVATGAVEVGGGVGMLVGLVRPALVPLAAVPLAATMVGALATHRRMGDPAKRLAPPARLLTLVIAVPVIRRRPPGGMAG